jgi:hypothetical protein
MWHDWATGPAPTAPSKKSTRIAEAFQMLEDSRCSCGQSSLLAWDPRNTGEYELGKDATCEACVVRDQDDARDEERQPGQKSYLINHLSDDVDGGLT